MRTRSSSNLVGESSPNPTTSNLKRHNRRRSKQPFILEESPLDTMVDQRTMVELLRAPTEGYAEAIVVPPILAEHFELKHSLINMMTSDQFFRLEKDNPHDHIRWFNKITSTIKYKDVPNSEIKPIRPRFFEFCRRGNLLERRTQDVLTIIENKSKIAKLTHAVNQQTSAVTTAMIDVLKQIQETPPLASVKAIKEMCVTCSGAHPYYQCLAADGNTFLELRDSIQGYVSAAAVNYNKGNSGYRPPSVANQIRPPGFAQQNLQNNQNRFSQPQGYNRGKNFNQDTSYQAPIQQNQVVPLSELEKIKKRNEININAMQTQINNVKNELRNEMKTSIQASMSNQTNELKNMMASFFQMITASTSGSGSLPSNTIANPKGELKSITTRSGLVLDGPFVPMPHPFINPEEDEHAEETLSDPKLAEYTIKIIPLLVQKAKPPSIRNYVVHQRDPRHPHIPYPSRMNQEKQQEKDEIQIHKFWKIETFRTANTPLNENCSAVIIKKLPEKLGDPGKFLIPYGFSELKCKALADLGASINLMPLSVWKKLGLPELIFTRMTLELANRAICTPARIARDVFVLVGKFTFPADLVIVDYEGDPRVPLILGRPFLRTARTLIDVHGEEMILRDGNERLTLNMRHDTSSYSNQPHKESINMINIYNDSYEDYLEDLFATSHLSSNPTFSSHTDLTSPKVINPLSGNTASSSPDHLLEEFADKLALITFPSENDYLPFDDSVDECNLADPNNDLVDTIPKMFTDEHTLDYSSPPLYDDVDDDLVKLESDNNDVYDDPFGSKEDKITESKLLIDKLDPPRSSDFLPSLEYDSFLYEDFCEVDALPSTNNEDKVFNPGILIHENLSEVTIRLTPDKNVKKISISNVSLILEDFSPPLYELPFHK
uniref:Reverse transcriptase domain-containing protein n=1 Tax=Tanacetum cinerariifolium TaxID=118510 RepID=A0A6L2N5G6_TANCI|nr:hypothetical protein [Tanacetum cinerariifolium]